MRNPEQGQWNTPASGRAMKIVATIIAVLFLLAFDAIRAIASGFRQGVYRVACAVARWGALT